MSRYNQNEHYYDPVGSQANQPTRYTYQGSAYSGYANPPASSGHTSSSYPSYGNQQYGASAQQSSSSSTSHAAAALSALSGGQNYNQASDNTASSSGRYNSSGWSGANTSSGNYGTASSNYATNPLTAPNRSQSNNSPLYASAQSYDTYGRRSTGEQQQSSTNTRGTSQMTYQNVPSTAGVRGNSYHPSHNQQQGQPPQRYNSPLHAVQAQQRSQTQQGWSSVNKAQSPQLSGSGQSGQQNKQQSSSVEPSATTVDPSQVYDNRAELQRKAQIEAEKRKKFEAEQAARKADEERVASAIAEEKRQHEAAKKAEEAMAKKAEAQKRKTEQKRQAREENKQNKDAAVALQRMSSGNAEDAGAPSTNDEEAEMRRMFAKMREFNAKNPAMLAKLWDEERKSHESSRPAPLPALTAIPQQNAASLPNARAVQNEVRPFAKPPTPSKPTKSVAATKQSAPAQFTPQHPRVPSGQTTTTTLWPPHKKGALAEVTAKWLVSLNANKGKMILAKDVLDILDQNPSYVQLCELLEGFGMSFDRSTLARELLKAVPDGMKPQTAPKVATPLTGLNGAAVHGTEASTGMSNTLKGKGKQRRDDSFANPKLPTTVNYEAPISLSDVAKRLNTTGRQPSYPIHIQNSPPRQQLSQSPYFASVAAMSNGSRPASQAGASKATPDLKPEEPIRPPADKEDAARKRSFGALVDLTAGDSDDDAPPPKKMMVPPPVSSNVSSSKDPSTFMAQPVSFKQFMYGQRQGGQVLSIHGPPGFHLPPQKPLASVSTPAGERTNGAQPSQPPAPPRPKGPSPEQLQLARMKGKMLVEPIMRDRVTRKSRYDSRTIARDVLLATGKHPDMRGLNAHLSVMQKLLGQHGVDSEGGNKSDLSTIRWDAIDPDPPKEEKELRPIAPKRAVDVDNEQADDETSEPSQPQRTAARSNSPPLLPLKKKKPGRTRKSEPVTIHTSGKLTTRTRAIELTNPDRAETGRNGSTRSHPSTPSPEPAPPSTMATAADGSTAVGYSAFHQIDPATGKKKKGRPFGWKKSIHSREAQGLGPATSHHAKPKQLRQPNTAASSPAGELVVPEYQVFRCEWKGCKSELHNVDTLKKHLVKVHGRKDASGGFECAWKGCTEKGTFGAIENWLKHVDGVHLEAVRWRLGDGPAVGDLSTFREPEGLPSYLKDAQGRAVTPLIFPPTPAISTTSHIKQETTATPDLQADPVPAMEPLPYPSPASNTTIIDVELKKLEHHQRIVGPILGKMGCVVANEARRTSFLDDEEFEDEVEGSEHGEGG